jgi:hypothetical protein
MLSASDREEEFVALALVDRMRVYDSEQRDCGGDQLWQLTGPSQDA